ncbi:MAG: YceI family protein, partial [Candidatus Dormibacteria bacterium]
MPRGERITTWTVDPQRTTVTYTVRLFGLNLVEGRFHEVHGSVRFDPRRPSAARGVARIAAASIDTGDPELDATHRGPDVFDAAAHPHIVLVSTSVTSSGGSRYRLVGDLTIRSVTREVAFDVDYGGITTDRRGDRRARITVTGSVDRA